MKWWEKGRVELNAKKFLKKVDGQLGVLYYSKKMVSAVSKRRNQVLVLFKQRKIIILRNTFVIFISLNRSDQQLLVMHARCNVKFDVSQGLKVTFCMLEKWRLL